MTRRRSRLRKTEELTRMKEQIRDQELRIKEQREEIHNFETQKKFLPRKLSISRMLIDDWLSDRL